MAEERDKWWEDEREIAELIWCAAHLHHIIPAFLTNLIENLIWRLKVGGFKK